MGQQNGQRQALGMKGLFEVAGKLADFMFLTTPFVTNFVAGGSLKSHWEHLSPLLKPKGPDQFLPRNAELRTSETKMEGKKGVLVTAICSLVVYLCLHLFPASHILRHYSRGLYLDLSPSL
jgi:hypothetical protein